MRADTGSRNASDVYSPTITGQGFFATRPVYCAGALRRLFHQKAHLRVGGLQDGMYAELFEGFGGGGSDGIDLALAQVGERGILDAEFARHAGEVHHLDGGGEQRHIEGSGRQAARGLAQGFDIFRQVPLVDAHGRHFGAARAQRRRSARRLERPYS